MSSSLSKNSLSNFSAIIFPIVDLPEEVKKEPIKPIVVDIKITDEGIYEITKNMSVKVDKKICYFITPNKTIWYNIESLPIIVRNRQNGDKIKLKTGTKSVSDFLTNKKVPYLQRKDTLVLCDEFNNILQLTIIYKLITFYIK